MKETKVYICASYIVFLFVKTEKDNFIRLLSVPSKPGKNPEQVFYRVSTASRVLIDMLLNFPKRSPRLSPGYEGTENMFGSENLDITVEQNSQWEIDCINYYNFEQLIFFWKLVFLFWI